MSPTKDNEIYKLKNKIIILQKQRFILVLGVMLLSISNIVVFFWHSHVISILWFLVLKCKALFNYLHIFVSKSSEWLVSQKIDIAKVFNNRELALGIWLLILIIYLLVNKKTRPSLGSLIKVAFDKKLTMLYICMMTYTSFIVYILYLVGFWEVSLLKDTILWLLFSGVVSAFQAIDKAENITYFKKVVLDNFKIVLIFQFIVNFYTFSLFGELILIPIIVIITLLISILDISPEFQDEKSKPVKKLFGFINILLGLYIAINSIVLAIKDIKNLGTIDTLKNILLPTILSTAFIVFVFLFALWSGYEQIFIRISFGEKKSKWLIAYIKIRVFLLCNFNFNRVKSFWRTSGIRILNASSESDVHETITKYKEQEKSRSNGIMLKN